MGTFTLTEGSVVSGRYCVIRELGRGGMGAVYEVLDSNTNRLRAMKVLLSGGDHDHDLFARFRQEATVAGRVESEHVVEVFDAGFDPGYRITYLVMELLRGEDLGAKLLRDGRLAPPQVIEALSQVALGLYRTHAEGIIHRDLKPENLFATKRDDGSLRMKILDFGIAKVVSGIGGTPRTTRAFGTPTYMAPEQLTGDGLIDERADLYALAHVAYTLLVGEPYFDPEHKAAKNVFAFAQVLLSGAHEPATARAAHKGVQLPHAFDAWFARATHADPAKRFATAPGQILALSDAFSIARPITLSALEMGRAKTLPVSSAISGNLTESSTVASASYPWRSRHTRWWAAGIGAGALAIGLSIWSFRKRTEPVLIPASAGSDSVPAPPLAPPPPPVAGSVAPPTPSASESLASPVPSARARKSTAKVRPKAPNASPSAGPAPKRYDPLDEL